MTGNSRSLLINKLKSVIKLCPNLEFITIMDHQVELYVHRLKRRIDELQNRLLSPMNWTNGEIEIFKTQIRQYQIKLRILEGPD